MCRLHPCEVELMHLPKMTPPAPGASPARALAQTLALWRALWSWERADIPRPPLPLDPLDCEDDVVMCALLGLCERAQLDPAPLELVWWGWRATDEGLELVWSAARDAACPWCAPMPLARRALCIIACAYEPTPLWRAGLLRVGALTLEEADVREVWEWTGVSGAAVLASAVQLDPRALHTLRVGGPLSAEDAEWWLDYLRAREVA